MYSRAVIVLAQDLSRGLDEADRLNNLVYLWINRISMKDQNASQQEVQSVFNAWWFKFALFGGATVVLAIWGSALWTGFAAGMGTMSLYKHFAK